MEVLIETLTDDLLIDKELEAEIIEAIEVGLNSVGYGSNYEVSVSIVDEKEIKELNAQYRNNDSVTDVLSFPLFERGEIPESGMLGDIVICSKRVFEQAEDLGHTYQREVIYLTIHSLLHLLGYDHIIEEEKIEMRAEEKKIMKTLGIFK